MRRTWYVGKNNTMIQWSWGSPWCFGLWLHRDALAMAFGKAYVFIYWAPDLQRTEP